MTDNLVYIANSGNAPHGITVAELDYNSGTLSPSTAWLPISANATTSTCIPMARFLVATTMDNGVQVSVVRH